MNARSSALHRSIAAAVDAQWRRPERVRVVINVPRPPSGNALTRNVSATERARAAALGKKAPPGRVKTDRHLTWLRAAGNEVLMQRPGRVSGAYELTLQVRRPDRKGRHDLANFEKAASDLLVSHGIIEDDSYAERVTIEWSDTVEGAQLIVEKWGGE